MYNRGITEHYDANGNRTSWRKRDGRVLTYGYDALDRVTAKYVPDGGNSKNILRFGWGWKGGAQTGNHVLRVLGDLIRAAGVKSGHVDFLNLPSCIFP